MPQSVRNVHDRMSFSDNYNYDPFDSLGQDEGQLEQDSLAAFVNSRLGSGNPLEESDTTLADSGNDAVGMLGAKVLVGGALAVAYGAAAAVAAYAWGKIRGRDKMD